jgi:hypothetical protein
LAFCGWARTLQPPPFVCPHTGVKTFRLAATDDGRIAAAEQIGVCGETGRRVLAAELVTCATTGKRVLAELAAVCPITGQRSLVTALSECTTCRQQVSPGALERGECAACRGLQATSKDDPRIVRLLAEFPALERWGSWRIAETASVFVLTAARWLRRVLLVADRQSLELKLVATGSRLFSGWDAVDPQQHELVLRD